MPTYITRITTMLALAASIALTLAVATPRYSSAAVGPCENPELPPTISGAGTIVGTSGDDIIHGSDGPDVIDGRSGNDVICGFGGNDVLIGGSGDDRMDGGFGSDEVNGGSGNDSVSGIINPGDDSAIDQAEGGSGNDFVSCALTLLGGSGDDHLSNGSPDAHSDGGSGADTCRVDESLDPDTGIPPAGSGSVTSCEEITSGPLG